MQITTEIEPTTTATITTLTTRPTTTITLFPSCKNQGQCTSQAGSVIVCCNNEFCKTKDSCPS